MINYCAVETTRGWVGLAGREGKLLRSTLPEQTKDTAIQVLLAGFDSETREDKAAFGNLPDRLQRYFEGGVETFADVELDLSDIAPFQAAALKATQQIPYGQTITYRDLARMAGSDRAARAAGNSMARNPFPLIVPCHRVVASDGGLGGFASGLAGKIDLLRMEGVQDW